ncbi:hypothetical protein [Anaerotignum sp.]|uniref:hypothetical protein n=1 Tax=Anaerotignum sp. TaxID=2039241 RepID=UPI002A912996|nr:hypothetical protein [Anaerotignum sp.]MCI7658259.1 hypothetical protein [Clostridia bacterium]MDY5415124.1 hypothetical protein [Anaerotignum sp.]
MRPSERMQQYRKPLVVGMVIFCCIIGGCLFPIVNCNPENPVETSLGMKTIILLSVFLFYTELGTLQSALFPKSSMGFVAVLNLALASLGLIFRYLLEFGEVSNTYNFTAPNVALHLFALTLLPLMTYAAQKYKS